MPWKETNVSDQRKEFVLESLKQFIYYTFSNYGLGASFIFLIPNIIRPTK